MNEAQILHWFYTTALGEVARNSRVLWPAFESLHFVGLCVLFGSLLVVDLRVLGLGKNLISVSSVMPFIPLAFAAGLLNVVTGISFFCAQPETYWHNSAFKWKMALFVFGGLNALFFEFFERRRLTALPIDADTGSLAKLVALGSMATWLVVMILGRTLPYTGSGG